uniref:ribosomal protein S17 n=1 Tax=Tsunamia transpacifica TaxID=1935457 RepID=UPI001BED8AC9|nr:ribosomal protein S17 [Tsunamia transpacifica]QUE27859.1 ribosomal protein S17 [Tsunamia transpacifica]UNJ14375.1 ribosomal protein S17 [Tsunamia transpacifica]
MSVKEKVGIVISNKMMKTLVLAVANKVLHSKYGKTMIRTKRYKVHVENENDYKIGDTLRIQETRPISRTKRWRVIDIVSKSPR